MKSADHAVSLVRSKTGSGGDYQVVEGIKKTGYGWNKKIIVFFCILTVVTLFYLIASSLNLSSHLQNNDINVDIDYGLGIAKNFKKIISAIRKRMSREEDVRFEPQQPVQIKRYSREKKRILIYTTMFGSSEWYDLPNHRLNNIMSSCKCKVKNCVVTYDNSLLNQSDAVVFHARDLPTPSYLRTLRESEGSVKQRWAYFTGESPENSPHSELLNGIFNLTMTYKKSSDVWIPYRKFEPLNSTERTQWHMKDYTKGKEPGAAWLTSHCGILRDSFVRSLQDEYPVYVGGNCHQMFRYHMSCQPTCDKEIQSKYKFYLAFENGFCREYITEKYWDRAILNDVIPIVMGGGPYDNGPFGAIPGSYIRVDDFATVKDLAKYLHYLDSNDTAYNEFFLWKQKYKAYVPPFGGWPYGCLFICKLCDILHNLDYPEKAYNSLSEFWGVAENCVGRDKSVKEIIARSVS